METLLIDLKNITTNTLSGWHAEWPIYLFVGEKQSKMKTELVQSLLPRGEKVHLIQVNGDGKNALDFHIAFEANGHPLRTRRKIANHLAT